MKYTLLPASRAALFFATALVLSAESRADDLTDAFNQLVSGRSYLKDFGTSGDKSKTRRTMVSQFLGSGGTHRRTHLQAAVDDTIAIRAAAPPEPATLSGPAPRSIQAREIAWQALEALGTGYLFAGNRDLMDGIRVAYPGSNPDSDLRLLPRDEPVPFPGVSQKNLTYARLYFMQPVKDILAYISRDTTGRLRAGSTAFPLMPHYVTFDDATSPILLYPAFDDPNFGDGAPGDREAAQSVAYLFGSALERMGMAVTSYADQLWRAAYTGPSPDLGRDPAQKQAMLDRAADVLRCEIHAQFLASLPLAAQLGDGLDGSPDEYAQSRMDQARVSVTGAKALLDKILSDEKPLQSTLVTKWDVPALESQINTCQIALSAAQHKFSDAGEGHVLADRDKSESAEDRNVERKATLRGSFESRLKLITGLDPSDYGGLNLDADRERYLRAVEAKYDALITKLDPGLVDGTEMGTQALRLIQAIREVQAAQARINSFPEQIRIELERNDAVNTTIEVSGATLAAIDVALALANSVSVSNSLSVPPSVSVSVNGGAVVAPLLIPGRSGVEIVQTIIINNQNSDALIRNLLLAQLQAMEDIKVIAVNVEIARNEFLRLLNEAKRLLEDHIFYQELTDTLWYRDPSLVFKLERSEEEYQDLVQEYRIQLYKLAKMLEAAWCESFANPVKPGSSGQPQPLDNGNLDAFTEAESVFGTVSHVDAEAFFNALRRWDARLRDPLFRGPADPQLFPVNIFGSQPISLRRDILGLIDYRYDPVSNQYLADETLERESIQRFRAFLLDLAARDPLNPPGQRLQRLRVDFPLTYQQQRIILGQDNPVPIVSRSTGGGLDAFWNHRVKRVAIRITGSNVFAGVTSVPVTLDLFGNVDRVGFFPDSDTSRVVSSFPVPLYQLDPDRILGTPLFGTTVQAALGTAAPVERDVNPWPLFCANCVLRIGNATGTLRIENIEDIEFSLSMEVGSPPAIPVF